MEESEIKRHTFVDSATLHTLVDHRLLRAEQTAEGTYYELSHDSLINAVLGSSRWSLTFRAGAYLIVGVASWVVVILALSPLVFLPLAFFTQSLSQEDLWTAVIVLPLNLVAGWIGWRAGIQNIAKFKDMRRRSKILRRAAYEIEAPRLVQIRSWIVAPISSLVWRSKSDS
jgi:hypothetical protein